MGELTGYEFVTNYSALRVANTAHLDSLDHPAMPERRDSETKGPTRTEPAEQKMPWTSGGGRRGGGEGRGRG